ncbi:hypothetical protein [Bradyrhizobium sp. 153]|uniref:hypothetical protein n=1 Tax=Bradyrhizobium sp. 153 TaxID=2782627 RepID=UPI001FF94BD8|nr:hypothetical protein [Bradyrhizobium sp. 153]MCK1668647.1 hypothetical protein [Bradyrhizobium sp. 153]
MDDAQKAALAWAAIYERISKHKSLKGLENELAEAMKFVSSRGPQSAIDLFEVAQMFKGRGVGPLPVLPASPPKKYPTPVWAIHKNKAGKKVKWTSTWEGMKLRVEHTTDNAGLVVFCGYIDEEQVAAEKTLKGAQTEVASTALDRARARDAS